MLVKLSTDTWRDVFDFLGLTDRKELALKFNEFGDREFSAVCQKWLHEWIKDVRIGYLEIDSVDGKSARLQFQCWDPKCKLKIFPIAGVELPANIIDFKKIQISYVGKEVLQFLRQMQPIFRNVNLEVRFQQSEESVEEVRNKLVHALPLINHIDSITSTDQLLFTIRDRLAVQFFAVKLLKVTALPVDDGFAVGLTELLLNWLGTRHVDGEPRILEMYFSNLINNACTFVEDIQRDFNNSTWPSSFFIYFSWFWYLPLSYVHESTTQNSNTNEQLLVRKPTDELRHLLFIGRCPSEEDGDQWIEKMIKKRNETHPIFGSQKYKQRKITISYPIPIPEANSEEEEEDDSEDEYAFLRRHD